VVNPDTIASRLKRDHEGDPLAKTGPTERSKPWQRPLP
jgi:hypothetical protein